MLGEGIWAGVGCGVGCKAEGPGTRGLGRADKMEVWQLLGARDGEIRGDRDECEGRGR